VHYTTSCNTQSSVPEDQRPKHVELIGIINKPLLLHLVGVYIIGTCRFYEFKVPPVLTSTLNCDQITAVIS